MSTTHQERREAAGRQGAAALLEFDKEHNEAIARLWRLPPRRGIALAKPSGNTMTFSVADASFIPAGLTSRGFARFKKSCLRSGLWRHPDNKNIEVNATSDYMEQLVKNFKRLKGMVDVYIPLGHSRDPQNNTGFVDDLELIRTPNGDELVGTFNIVDAGIADKIRQGAIRGVSVAIDPAFKVSYPDGRVEEVGDFVEHVSLTMCPVIGAMGGFSLVT